MRGDHEEPEAVFSYITPAQRVPKDHPLRAIRTMVDEVLRRLWSDFEKGYDVAAFGKELRQRGVRMKTRGRRSSVRTELVHALLEVDQHACCAARTSQPRTE